MRNFNLISSERNSVRALGLFSRNGPKKDLKIISAPQGARGMSTERALVDISEIFSISSK